MPMPSLPPHTSTTTSPSTAKRDLPSLLAAARPFLRDELEKVDPALPALIATLRAAGAGECWHKHGTFLAHLTGVYRILKLWGAPDAVALCGLYHSAYSNSYVNLAIFDPSASRSSLRSLLGPTAERLVHLFCVVDRQALIHDSLLFRYPDPDLSSHLPASELSLRAARERGEFDEGEPWREKVRELVPAGGVRVRHIKTGEEVAVSRRVVACFVMMTMADFSDQLFGFQDQLFDNADGRLEFAGSRPLTAFWPGDGKPGLYMNSVSRMGALYTLLAREEELYCMEQRVRTGERDEEIELAAPPVFEGCTRVVGAEETVEARDLYWGAVCGGGEGAEGALVRCVEKNPYAGEPHLVLAQAYLGMGRYEEAEEEAERGLRMVLEWGCPWDKRVSWEGWVSWGRVMLMKARERSWPHTAWGILNLGLVR